MQYGGKRKGAGRPLGQGKYGETTKPIRIPISLIKPVLKFIDYKRKPIPLFSSKVAAGLPTLADDHVEEHLDLNDYLIKDPASTFFVKVSGNSMIDADIYEDDLLIIDRSITPSHGKIVIASIDGQLTVKRLQIKNNKLSLLPENKNFQPIDIIDTTDFHILGVVTNVIHAIK